MAEWFSADHHFGHANIIRFCKRPVLDMRSMIDMLVAKHNERVKPEDNCYFLGDMFWRTLGIDQTLEIFSRLTGKKHYVLGNHEEMVEGSWALQNQFVWVKERAFISYPNVIHTVVLDHYSGRVWRNSHRGAYQLYGHSHGELPHEPGLLSMDVGVDCIGYAPISLDEVVSKMKQKADLIDRQKKLDVLKAEQGKNESTYVRG